MGACSKTWTERVSIIPTFLPDIIDMVWGYRTAAVNPAHRGAEYMARLNGPHPISTNPEKTHAATPVSAEARYEAEQAELQAQMLHFHRPKKQQQQN